MAFLRSLSRVRIQSLCKWGRALTHSSAALSVLGEQAADEDNELPSPFNNAHLQSQSLSKALEQIPSSPSLSLGSLGKTISSTESLYLNRKGEEDLRVVEESLKSCQIREKNRKLSEFREKLPNLSHFLVGCDMLWESAFFPLNPEYFLHADPHMLMDLSLQLRPLLQSAIEEYPDDIKEASSDSPSPKPGEYFDVFSLLSSFGDELVRNNGDRVVLHPDTFVGRNVLICCFHVPVPAPWGSYNFQSLINLCNELYSTREDEFEMVMVARMNSLANAPEVFDHFFSGFPSSCLAVPFKDSKRRDLICKVLGLGLCRDQFECLFLNANGKVSPFFTHKIFEYYGAEAFPFTEKDIIESDNKCRVIVDKAGCLESVLRCNTSSPNYVYRAGGSERVLISQLSSNKHIGLFLCCHGYLIPNLLDMYEQCRGKQLGFEIVVVYLPFASEVDPQIFKKQMDDLLQKHNAYSWWCLPFDNSVSRRFWRLTHMHENCYDYCQQSDRLIVVGPGVGRLDMYGAEVMERKGIEAYPFTTDAVIHKKITKLREITLDLLFDGTDIPVEELRGRKVFIIIDSLKGRSDFNTLVPIYPQIKEEFACELIFVEDVYYSLIWSSELVSEEERSEITSKMPWRVCSIINTPLMELIRELGTQTLFGFGCDGRICSATYIAGGKFSMEDFSSGYSLYRDVESSLGFDDFLDREMDFFSYNLSCL